MSQQINSISHFDFNCFKKSGKFQTLIYNQIRIRNIYQTSKAEDL
jgi:hypothetical protein